MVMRRKLPKQWRPLAAYGIVFAGVTLVLLNLVSDALVSRYEATAEREPGTVFLKGMAPRELGPEAADRAVLFVHGFAGAPSNFGTLPDAVAATGWYVVCMRLPGHGTSPRDFESTAAEELIEGVRREILSLQEDYGTVVVVAHSMGGAIATLVAAETPVDGLVLCAPYFGLHYDRILGIKTSWIAPRAATLIRWMPGRPGNGPVADPAGRKLVDCYGWLPMAGALTALEIGRRANDPAVLGALTMPVLAIHASGDTVTSQAATARAVAQMSRADVDVQWLEESDHVIFLDYEKGIVEEKVVGFIEEVRAS